MVRLNYTADSRKPMRSQTASPKFRHGVIAVRLIRNAEDGALARNQGNFAKARVVEHRALLLDPLRRLDPVEDIRIDRLAFHQALSRLAAAQRHRTD